MLCRISDSTYHASNKCKNIKLHKTKCSRHSFGINEKNFNHDPITLHCKYTYIVLLNLQTLTNFTFVVLVSIKIFYLAFRKANCIFLIIRLFFSIMFFF